jgi:hypothetical protein
MNVFRVDEPVKSSSSSSCHCHFLFLKKNFIFCSSANSNNNNSTQQDIGRRKKSLVIRCGAAEQVKHTTGATI